jgi:hypothetical protein
MRENHGVDFQACLSPQEATGLNGMRLNIPMDNHRPVATLFFGGQQIFKLSNLVAAINLGASAVVLDPEVLPVG